ncbi:hypothetical protein, partial [Tsukamurella soli]
MAAEPADVVGLTRAQLLDPATVRGAVRRLGAALHAPDDRVAGTLFWYSLSGGLARLALLGGGDVASAELTVTVGPGAWPSGPDAPAA